MAEVGYPLAHLMAAQEPGDAWRQLPSTDVIEKLSRGKIGTGKIVQVRSPPSPWTPDTKISATVLEFVQPLLSVAC